jgi:hypothetical protein
VFSSYLSLWPYKCGGSDRKGNTTLIAVTIISAGYRPLDRSGAQYKRLRARARHPRALCHGSSVRARARTHKLPAAGDRYPRAAKHTVCAQYLYGLAQRHTVNNDRQPSGKRDLAFWMPLTRSPEGLAEAWLKGMVARS